MSAIGPRAFVCALVPLLFLATQGCTGDRKPSTTTQATAADSDIPRARDGGGYELAEVLAWAMPKSAANAATLPSLQDYNRFKGVVSDIKRSEGGDGQYVGKVVPLVDGTRVAAENIEDDYAWRVWIDGPQAGAASVKFDSFGKGNAVSAEIGPAYLRRHGFDLVALACFGSGGTPNNADAMYLARFPGKAPTLMTFSVSTGSGGVFNSWLLHYVMSSGKTYREQERPTIEACGSASRNATSSPCDEARMALASRDLALLRRCLLLLRQQPRSAAWI